MTTASSASGTVGGVFGYLISATNSPTSYGASGLPSGLSVNASTGLISGTPSARGTYYATITATNSAGTASASLSISITTGGTTSATKPTLSSPVQVAADPDGRLPRIKKWGNNIYVLNGGTNRNLLFYKSSDNGLSFTSTSLATPVVNFVEYEFCMDTNGYLYALWLQSSIPTNQMYIRKSLDGGATWSTQTSIASGVDGSQLSCQYSNGSLYVLYRAFQNGANELFLTKSSDNGNSFSSPVKVTNNGFQEEGGKLAIYGNNVYVVYFDYYSTTPGNVYLATSLNGGASFGSQTQVNRTSGKADWGPSIAVDDLGNLYVAYSDTTSNSGDIYVAKSSNGGSSFSYTLATDSVLYGQEYPKVFVDGNNYLYLLWDDNRDRTPTGSTLFFTRSVNGGATYEANLSIDSAGRISGGSLYIDSGTVYLAAMDFKTSPTSTIFKTISYQSAPDAPAIGTATGGNAQATVSFSAPASSGGGAITGYSVTSSPGGITATGMSSPIIVTGLTNNTSYTFTVTATSGAGTSVASAASNVVTPSAPGSCGANNGRTLTITPTSDLCSVGTASSVSGSGPWFWTCVGSSGSSSATCSAIKQSSTAPGAPTSVSATSGNSQATLSFNTPTSDGGSAITGYIATCGGIKGTGIASPITVSGLTNGTVYSCSITASNLVGTSVASTAVNVMPVATYTITVTKLGTGFGTITANPNDINCGAICIAHGTAGNYVMTLTATPASGSTFAGWGGDCTGTGSCNLTLTASKNVTANFTPVNLTYTLSIGVSGTGSGTVTSNPSGINCGSACNASFNSGTNVTLAATSGSGSTFAGWSGACAGTGSCIVTMSTTQSVTANFKTTTLVSGFLDNNDGTVTDPKTGLTWMRCSMGQSWADSTCAGTANTYTWDQATALTGTVNFTNQSDWRLPTIRELQTIVDRTVYSPALNAIVFPNTPPGSSVWTSTPGYGSSTNAWIVDTFHGSAQSYSKVTPSTVRLVRGGSRLSILNLARPTTDFIDHGDGTVTDTVSGLMWKRCAEGQTSSANNCLGTARTMDWYVATALTSTFVGQSDWRLPTIEELMTLTDYERSSPAINPTVFPGDWVTPYAAPQDTPNLGVWSSSTFAYYSGNAWGTVPNTGAAFYGGYKGWIHQALLVRTSSLATAPSAPTNPSAVSSNAQATVSFTAPANTGGTSITGYTVTSSPGNITIAGIASPITVIGLTNGTAYSFTVTATNSAGTSIPSSASNAVTPGEVGGSASDCIFAWAENYYPELFSPARATSKNIGLYYYRYYTATNSYLATSDSHLYYLGLLSGGSILDVGAVSTWLGKAGCSP